MTVGTGYNSFCTTKGPNLDPLAFNSTHNLDPLPFNSSLTLRTAYKPFGTPQGLFWSVAVTRLPHLRHLRLLFFLSHCRACGGYSRGRVLI
jgi:hypothetical protein